MADIRLLVLPLALILDTVLGDPQCAAHPVRLVGALASRTEAICRRLFVAESVAGTVAWFFVVGFSVAVSIGLLVAARWAGEVAYVAVAALVVYITIAPRDLAVHAIAVGRALQRGDLEEARRRAGFMVSRDLRRADEGEIVRAVVESTAENLVDGTVAPLLFAALIGPAGAVLFRVANTLDAMFGYKNERFLRFGRFSAKADDLLAWLPARIGGPIFCLAAPLGHGDPRRAFRIMRRDRKNHESPNGGIVEAAAAGALGVRLGGPSVYFDATVHKPVLGDANRTVVTEDIFRTVRMTYGGTVLLAVASLGLWYLRLRLMGVLG